MFWVKVITTLYKNFVVIINGCHCRWHRVWSRVMQLLNKTNEKCIVPHYSLLRQVGNSNVVLFGRYVWIGNVPLSLLFSTLFCLDIDKDCVIKY